MTQHHIAIPSFISLLLASMLSGCLGPIVAGPAEPAPDGPTPSGSLGGGATTTPDGCLANLPSLIDADLTLEAGCTVQVPEDTQVLNGATLFVEGGARLELGPAVRLYIGHQPSGYSCGENGNCNGGLVARGSTDAPAVFTSASAFPAPGDWGGIVIGDEPVGIITLEGAHIEYAGQGPRDNMGAVHIRDITRRAPGRIAIANTIFEHNSFGAIEATAGTNQAVHGMFERFESNRLTDNGTYAVRLTANTMPDLDAASVIEDPLLVAGGNSTTAPGTWHAFDAPYVFDNGLAIYDGAMVTLSEGAELLFPPGYGITVGSGTLVADGVTFGSTSAVPIPGEWDGIKVHGTLALTNSRIRNSGSAGNRAVVNIHRGANVHMSGTTFEGSVADRNVSTYEDDVCPRLMAADPPNVFDLPIACES